MFISKALSVLLAAACAYAQPATPPGACRCTPDKACWPSTSAWNSLNTTVQGRLVAVQPIAYVCHDPNYDAAACAEARAMGNNSLYRGDQPGAVQYENWEAWPKERESCYRDSPRSQPCGQGRTSLYSVLAESAANIQAAVKFAAQYQLRLAIRNTGHDFIGRSAAPESLQIFTHKMKNITVVDHFVPSVPGGVKPPAPVQAVTIGAGVQLREMYAYLGTQGVMVVGGASNTVGVAGGYIQAGGHGILGHFAGMGSDNALEFTVVTANGALVKANAYQNTNLFWALRGGGGGTFGVVVSVTVRAYPDIPVVFAQANITLRTADARYWKAVETFHEYLPGLNDNGGTGYYYMTPVNPVPGVGNVATFLIYMWYVNKTDPGPVNNMFAPILDDFRNLTGTEPYYQSVAFPTTSSMYTTIFDGADVTGFQVVLGSRMISHEFISTPGSPATIAQALSTFKMKPGEYIEGNVVGGGQTRANAGRVDSALNPAWRSTLSHLLFIRLWDANTSFEEQAAIRANVTDVEVPILRSFEPGRMGAYMNEADPAESNFQQSFWGSNYARLYAIKQLYDPNSLFITRRGVGSENWDDDGLCRVF